MFPGALHAVPPHECAADLVAVLALRLRIRPTDDLAAAIDPIGGYAAPRAWVSRFPLPPACRMATGALPNDLALLVYGRREIEAVEDQSRIEPFSQANAWSLLSVLLEIPTGSAVADGVRAARTPAERGDRIFPFSHRKAWEIEETMLSFNFVSAQPTPYRSLDPERLNSESFSVPRSASSRSPRETRAHRSARRSDRVR